MTANEPNLIYDIVRFASVVLFVFIVIFSVKALRKLKTFYMVYATMAITLFAFSGVFSVLRFWFYGWEFALLEYVFFALASGVCLVMYLNIKKSGQIDGDGIPTGDKIDN